MKFRMDGTQLNSKLRGAPEAALIRKQGAEVMNADFTQMAADLEKGGAAAQAEANATLYTLVKGDAQGILSSQNPEDVCTQFVKDHRRIVEDALNLDTSEPDEARLAAMHILAFARHATKERNPSGN